MSFSVPGYTSATPAGVTSVSISVPSGVADGDFLILTAITYTSGAWNPPAGWNVLFSGGLPLAATHQFILAWRTASSEPASYTLNVGSSAWPAVIMYAARGGQSANPLAGSAFSPGVSYQTTITPPAYTPHFTSSLFIYGYGGINQSGSGGGGMTLPSPSSLLPGSVTADVNNSSGGTDMALIATTSPGPGNATIPTGVDQCAFTAELNAQVSPALGSFLTFFP